MILKGWGPIFILLVYGFTVVFSLFFFHHNDPVTMIVRNDLCNLEVFSHRGAVMDDVSLTPGSIESVTLLMKNGVCSFDVDCFQTVDGELVIGHPQEMTTRLQLSQTPDQMTMAQLRSIDHGQISSVREFLKVAHDMKSECNFVNKRHHVTGLRVLIEPKGESASLDNLHQIASIVKELGYIKGEVGLWLTNTDLAVRTQDTLLEPLAPIKNGLGSPTNSGGVFRAIGPSIYDVQLVDVIGEAKLQGQTTFVWVVDHPSELDIISGLGVNGIISNQPIAMKRYLSALCKV
jgi:glycerophosphoryl diester phosphodiesterase